MEPFDDYEDHIDNWNDYISRLNERCDEMYNLINYNQFVNEEVRRMDRKIRFLSKDLEKQRSDYNDLSKKYDSIKENYFEVRDKYDKSKGKSETHSLKRLRDDSRWLSSEKRKRPRNYEYLKKDIMRRRLDDVFSKVKNIDDIINLKNLENKHDFFGNDKFDKLYKLIPSLEELNNMIGMDKIKKDIFDTICFFIHGLNNKEELNHVVITGDPGVGKTTLARLIGRIYLSLGFLKTSNFITARRSDLIAQYLGQTAPKTQKVIDEAEGGVLFIDEIYSLGNSEKRDSFAKECIDTINQNLTEKCDKFLCIVAGYKEDVEKCFFAYNKGLERRFTVRYQIDKYSIDDLSKILIKFIEDDKWKIDFDPKELISKNFNVLKNQGGDLRTVFKIAKQEYSIRLMNSSSNIGTGDKCLKKDDIETSIKKMKEQRDTGEMPEYLKHIYV